MDAETDVGHVVDVLATHKPDNLADLAFGIIAGHPGKSLGVNLFVPCQLGGIVPVRDTIERHMPAVLAWRPRKRNLGEGRNERDNRYHTLRFNSGKRQH